MTKKQTAKVLAGHKERKQAKRADRLVVVGYPHSHNPYVPHLPVEDCFKGCVLMKDWKGLDGPIRVEEFES